VNSELLIYGDTLVYDEMCPFLGPWSVFRSRTVVYNVQTFEKYYLIPQSRGGPSWGSTSSVEHRTDYFSIYNNNILYGQRTKSSSGAGGGSGGGTTSTTTYTPKLYNIVLRDTTELSRDVFGDSKLFGNKFIRYDSGHNKIFLHDLSGNIECIIDDVFSLGNKRPDYWGGENVAWISDTSNQQTITQYNLTTQERRELTNSDSAKQDVVINDENIMWIENIAGSSGFYSEVKAYNLEDDSLFQITDTGILSAQKNNFFVWENILVWEDNRNGNWDIFAYDMKTCQEFQVTSDLSNQLNPAIHGNMVVWQDYRNGTADIYGAVIPEPSTILMFLSGIFCIFWCPSISNNRYTQT